MSIIKYSKLMIFIIVKHNQIFISYLQFRFITHLFSIFFFCFFINACLLFNHLFDFSVPFVLFFQFTFSSPDFFLKTVKLLTFFFQTQFFKGMHFKLIELSRNSIELTKSYFIVLAKLF